MMSLLRLFAFALVAAFGLVSGAAWAQSPDDRPAFEKGALSIETAGGKVLDFTVEIAKTDRERAFGLMFVKELPEDQGMLFLYSRPQRLSMWMRNTLIPLDMLFIRADGSIESIARQAIPLDETVLRSQGRVSAVLEIGGGRAALLGIAPGDRVIHPAFASK